MTIGRTTLGDIVTSAESGFACGANVRNGLPDSE